MRQAASRSCLSSEQYIASGACEKYLTAVFFQQPDRRNVCYSDCVRQLLQLKFKRFTSTFVQFDLQPHLSVRSQICVIAKQGSTKMKLRDTQAHQYFAARRCSFGRLAMRSVEEALKIAGAADDLQTILQVLESESDGFKRHEAAAGLFANMDIAMLTGLNIRKLSVKKRAQQQQQQQQQQQHHASYMSLCLLFLLH